MTAISKAWVTIGDAAVDPDSPLDATLMTGIRDDLVHLREWLGASFFAGAIQDHDHDGLNSKLVLIGPNYVRNPGFEADLGGWTVTAFSGGTVARTTGAGNFSQGLAALGITSTVLANGGGDVLLNEFKPVNAGDSYPVHVDAKGSVANVSSKAEVHWYDSAQSLISTSTLYSDTNTPTSFTQKSSAVVAPASARFAKIRLTGGVPGSGSATGTIYFDNVFFGERWAEGISAGSLAWGASLAENSATSESYTKVKEITSPFTGTMSTSFDIHSSSSAAVSGQININGIAVGTQRSTTSTSYVNFTENLDVKKGDLVQLFIKVNAVGPTVFCNHFILSANIAVAPGTSLGDS